MNPLTASSPSALANPAFGRAAAALAVYEAASKAHERLNELARSRMLYTVSVEETEPLYPDVHAWLLDVLPSSRQRALLVTTGARNRDRDTPSEVDSSTSGDELRLMFNSQRTRRITIDGHRVRVEVSEPDRSTSSNSASEYLRPARIIFGTYTHAGQQAVIRHLQQIHADRVSSRRPRLRMPSQWGGWNTRDDLPPRSLASVALPAEQKARIVGDLRRFLADEGKYNRLAVPWHRGYLFHGPPGTGKTSLVRALASEFGLELWYVALSDLKSETSLMDLLARVTPRSVLLLEDIDTVEISHERDTAQGSISMSSLLNALDGVATPHGLITVMTTNHFDKLDPALTRPGRMDLVEEIAPMSGETLAALFHHFYDQPIPAGFHPAPGLTAAAASEAFKRHLGDPTAALSTLTHHRQEANDVPVHH